MYATPVTPTGFHEPVQEALPKAIQRIVDALHPEKIILFGSYAHGTPTTDSDVDLLVIMETTASQTERFVAVSNLLYPRRFPVDILVKTPQELEQALQRGDYFLCEIILKGQVLYDR
jgi:predicted nucleotidyltransferase